MYTVVPRFSNASVLVQFGSRTKIFEQNLLQFSNKFRFSNKKGSPKKWEPFSASAIWARSPSRPAPYGLVGEIFDLKHNFSTGSGGPLTSFGFRTNSVFERENGTDYGRVPRYHCSNEIRMIKIISKLIF